MSENWHTMNRRQLFDKIEQLKIELEAEREFRTALEEWLDSNHLSEDDGDDYWVISPSVHTTFRETRDKFNELKAQHIDSGESEVTR